MATFNFELSTLPPEAEALRDEVRDLPQAGAGASSGPRTARAPGAASTATSRAAWASAAGSA